MKQKIVIKVPMDCEKYRIKAMTIAASTVGVNTMAVQGNDNDQLVVVGEGIDSAALTSCLRKKVGYAKLVTVEEVKDQKPPQQEKKDGKGRGETQANPEKSKPPPPYPHCYGPPYPCPQFYMYDVPVDDSPSCIIL